MRNLIGLGLTFILLAGADADAARKGKSPQGSSPAKQARGKATRPPLDLIPRADEPQTKSEIDVYGGILLAVFPDSVVIERDIDPAVVAAWLRQGTVQNGVSQLAAIVDLVVVEDRVLERVYFDDQTVDPVSAIRPHLQRAVTVLSRAEASGRRYLCRIKP